MIFDTPIRIGQLDIPNRLVMPPMQTNKTDRRRQAHCRCGEAAQFGQSGSDWCRACAAERRALARDGISEETLIS